MSEADPVILDILGDLLSFEVEAAKEWCEFVDVLSKHFAQNMPLSSRYARRARVGRVRAVELLVLRAQVSRRGAAAMVRTSGEIMVNDAGVIFDTKPDATPSRANVRPDTARRGCHDICCVLLDDVDTVECRPASWLP